MRRSLSDISPVLTVRDLSNYLRVHPGPYIGYSRQGSCLHSRSAATGASTSKKSTAGASNARRRLPCKVPD